MMEALYRNAARRGIELVYECPAYELMTEGDRVTGVRAKLRGKEVEIRAGAVVLACGGFESNPEMRARYLGRGWDMAKVRGTRFNMGQGLTMALDIGAKPHGNWSGCHSVAWDINAPPTGDLSIGDQFQKHSYPYGIVVNGDGKRFMDEGLNFHSHTYAMYGGRILEQPGMFAWQVFDAKANPLLRSEYRIRRVTKAEANTIEELAEQLDGVNAAKFIETVHAFNAACTSQEPFNPNILDGRRTTGLEIDKTNWANPLDTPPFHAYHVTTGITFTFGGLKVTTAAEVEHQFSGLVGGLYAAGEIVGGLYFQNYGSGTGLMAGAIFGRLAGTGAAAFAKLRNGAAGKAAN